MQPNGVNKSTPLQAPRGLSMTNGSDSTPNRLISDRDARNIYRLTQKDIMDGIDNGYLHFRRTNHCSNSYLDLFTSEVEKYVVEKHGAESVATFHTRTMLQSVRKKLSENLRTVEELNADGLRLREQERVLLGRLKVEQKRMEIDGCVMQNDNPFWTRGGIVAEIIQSGAAGLAPSKEKTLQDERELEEDSHEIRQEPKESKEPKAPTESKTQKESKTPKDHTEPKASKEAKAPKGHPKRPKEQPKRPKEQLQRPKEQLKQPKELQKLKEPKENGEPKESQELKSPKEQKGPKESKELKETKELEATKETKSPKELDQQPIRQRKKGKVKKRSRSRKSIVYKKRHREWKCPIEPCPKVYSQKGGVVYHIKMKHPKHKKRLVEIRADGITWCKRKSKQ